MYDGNTDIKQCNKIQEKKGIGLKLHLRKEKFRVTENSKSGKQMLFVQDLASVVITSHISQEPAMTLVISVFATGNPRIEGFLHLWLVVALFQLQSAQAS